jgi:hypothetical protein
MNILEPEKNNHLLIIIELAPFGVYCRADTPKSTLLPCLNWWCASRYMDLNGCHEMA